jgi:hypothetical protein
VDIWDETGARELNVVKHGIGSPAVSISASHPISFPPQPERMMLVPSTATHMYQGVPGAFVPHTVLGYPPLGYVQHMQSHTVSSPQNYGPAFPMALPQGPITASNLPNSQFSGNYTRNLIGSTTVSAVKLKDAVGQWGLWFVLQDLSVRTEGNFRLKYSVVDLYDVEQDNQITQGTAAVVASAFSDTFKVYSAKKFPGVIESTALSKAFAQQGIKIPIRKDAKAGSDEYDADEVGLEVGASPSEGGH